MHSDKRVIAIVGGGPSSVYATERLAALATAGQIAKHLTLHIFDKAGCFGDGEVHSAQQPEVSFLNRIAGQVAFAADETVEGAAPLLAPRYRRNLAQWCEQRYSETGNRRYAVGEADWPKRSVHGEALKEHFNSYIQLLREAGVAVALHGTEVIDIDTRQDRMRLLCSDGSALEDVDHALLVTGHSWNDPTRDPRHRARAVHARKSDSQYVSSAYPLEQRITLDTVQPGSVVACEGMGLTTIDIVLYLTEGRGGVFQTAGDGLTYHPSGEEPSRIIPFSGSGLFTFARPDNQKQIDLALHQHRGEFLTEESVDVIRAYRGVPGLERRQLDFERDVFPLILAEMGLVHAATLFGREVGTHLANAIRNRLTAFLTSAAPLANAASKAVLGQLREETLRVASLVDKRLDGTLSLDECVGEAINWDFSLAAASFIQCVWGESNDSPIGTVIAADVPRRYLRGESPYGMPTLATRNLFDWQEAIRPIPESACGSPQEYRAAMLNFFKRDNLAAAHGNLSDPAKAAADGVWRDLRDVLAYAVDRGGLTPTSHRRFLEEYMRHHNRLANGAAREVMSKIHAVAESGILDVGVGPSGSLRLDEHGFTVLGKLTGYRGHADTLIDARVHAFDPRLDTAVLYRNLMDRGVVKLWVNVAGNEPSESFIPGGLDLDANFSPRTTSGAVEHRLTVLGPPSEGVVFFQLGALRPDQNHHVMRDILVWIDKLARHDLVRPTGQRG